MRVWGDLCYDIIIVLTVFLTLYTPLDFYELRIVESKIDLNPNNSNVEPESNKYEKQNITEKKIERIYIELLNYMKKDKPFLENSLTIKELADDMKIPLHHLSLIINSKTKQNFHTFINSYRVEEAQRIIKENVNKGKDETLLNIAMNSGFNSKTSFNTFFKKSTGLTPSEFRDNINKHI